LLVVQEEVVEVELQLVVEELVVIEQLLVFLCLMHL
jgi:hypothetical protein